MFKSNMEKPILRMMTARAIVLISALISSQITCADDETPPPVIDSIDGDQVVVVKTPEGHKIGAPGSTVHFGDRIKTGPRASAKIRFADGSKLIIGRGTEMEVQLPEDGVQKNELLSGTVRGVIKKAKTLEPNKVANPVPRFVIKTKAAVMGVRGTDFVFTASDSSNVGANLKTLDGVVDVAKDEKTLMEGRGVSVHPNEEVSADAQSVSQPKNFNRDQYVREVQASQPSFVSMGKSDPDVNWKGTSTEGLRDLPKPYEGPTRKLIEPWHFELSPVYVAQKLGGYSYSAAPTFSPRINLLGLVGVVGHVSLYPLKGRTDNDRFNATEVGLLVSPIFLYPLIAELGPVNLKWGTKIQGEIVPLAVVGLHLGYDSRIDRIFVSYTSFHPHPIEGYSDDNLTKIVKAGVGLSF